MKQQQKVFFFFFLSFYFDTLSGISFSKVQLYTNKAIHHLNGTDCSGKLKMPI